MLICLLFMLIDWCLQMFMAITELVLRSKQDNQQRIQQQQSDTVKLGGKADKSHKKRANKCC